jgi:hypothetical protein
MTVTVTPSVGPRLDLRTEVGVRIVKLPSRAELAASLGCDPSDAAVMVRAATLATPAQRTDIVVFDHQPWHKVGSKLLPHPQVHIDHPETILKLSHKKKEVAVWWSEQPFTVTAMRRSDHHPAVAGSPASAFEGPPPPYEATSEQDLAGRQVWAVRTKPIVQEAVHQMYKVNFLIGENIDPDMEGAP